MGEVVAFNKVADCATLIRASLDRRKAGVDGGVKRGWAGDDDPNEFGGGECLPDRWVRGEHPTLRFLTQHDPRFQFFF